MDAIARALIVRRLKDALSGYIVDYDESLFDSLNKNSVYVGKLVFDTAACNKLLYSSSEKIYFKNYNGISF